MGVLDVKAGFDAAQARAAVERRLGALVPSEQDAPQRLHAAMRYAVLAPGKRLRPLLCLAAAQSFGRDGVAALDAGCALEMVHASSLVFDDLPCMDDAKLRRGRPTTHLAFDEATAVLAGIALLNRAFGVVARLADTPCDSRAAMTAMLAQAIGSQGLSAGQTMDIHDRAAALDATQIDAINHLKTGVLFVLSVDFAAELGQLAPQERAQLREFAAHFGAAFQALDDLADALKSAAETGKDANQDKDKASLVGALGLARTKAKILDHVSDARRILRETGRDCAPLHAFLDVAIPVGI